MKAHALAIAFLPAFIRYLLNVNLVANAHDLVDQSPMQALAMGRKPALLMCKSASRSYVTLAILPRQALFAAFLDAAHLVVVLRVVGTALAV
jgi:hypothetical protein